MTVIQKNVDVKSVDSGLKEDLEGKCWELWRLNGGQTKEWNGDSCDCEFIQGRINCKLNPY